MITISIKTDNAAFGEFPGSKAAEVARILREIAWRMENGHTAPMRAADSNGNCVCKVKED